MVDRATINRWRELHGHWWVSEQLSRKAQGEVRIALEEFALGGARPTIEQLEQMDALRHEAERCRLRLEALILDVMR